MPITCDKSSIRVGIILIGTIIVKCRPESTKPTLVETVPIRKGQYGHKRLGHGNAT